MRVRMFVVHLSAAWMRAVDSRGSVQEAVFCIPSGAGEVESITVHNPSIDSWIMEHAWLTTADGYGGPGAALLLLFCRP